MRGPPGLDTEGERPTSLLESIGTGPDRSLAHKQDSCVFQSLNTVTNALPLRAVFLKKVARETAHSSQTIHKLLEVNYFRFLDIATEFSIGNESVIHTFCVSTGKLSVEHFEQAVS